MSRGMRTRVTVELRLERTGDQVVLTVRDDGRGLPPAARKSSHGIRGMRERAMLIGAAFTIKAAPERGTEVRLSIPLDVARHDHPCPAGALADRRCGPHPIAGGEGRQHTPSMIRLALLDDHPAVLVGLQRVIEQEPDIVIVGAAPTAPALARQLGDIRADVLVVDHDVARSDGLSQSRRIKDRPHPPGVIIYSAFARQTLALPARVAHADAVVDKAEPVASLLAAIRSVARGETVLPPVPRAAYDAATARLDGEDLPVFAMLLDGETGARHRRRVAGGDRRDRVAGAAHHRPLAARRLRPARRAGVGVRRRSRARAALSLTIGATATRRRTASMRESNSR